MRLIVIDKWDTINLLYHAPNDEYDLEKAFTSREILFLGDGFPLTS